MPDRQHHRPPAHWWRTFLQDARVFVRLFPWRVALTLALGVAVLALGFMVAYNRVETPPLSYIKAVFAVLNMSLLQVDYSDMPSDPHLDLFFVLTPMVGIPLFLLFGVNMVELVRVFFVRSERGPLWQTALAATTSHPVVLCGLGRVGYRIALPLLELDIPVVGIDTTPTPLIQALIDRGMPVLIGDVRSEAVLRQAGVERARAVIVCTDQDLVNLEAAFHIRELNPRARVVLRLFEDELSDALQKTTRLAAVLSRSAVAAIAFAHAAAGVQVLETFDLDGSTYLLARLPLRSDSPLLGHPLSEIAEMQDISVVCLLRKGKLTIEPAGDTLLCNEDALIVFSSPKCLEALAEGHALGVTPPGAHRPILVSGLGHTGYRIAQQLRASGHPVVGITAKRDRLQEQLKEKAVRVIVGDGRLPSVLRDAGVEQAAALIACDEDDMHNIQTALRARELNPHIRIVVRIFEEELGRRLQETFAFDAVYSTSMIAAPAFLDAALDLRVAQPVESLTGHDYLLASLPIQPQSPLRGVLISTLHDEPNLTVLLLTREGRALIPPPLDVRLRARDELVVLASREKLGSLTMRET